MLQAVDAPKPAASESHPALSAIEHVLTDQDSAFCRSRLHGHYEPDQEAICHDAPLPLRIAVIRSLTAGRQPLT
jgi:hypothetical protein